MTYNAKSIRILLLPILVSITGISCTQFEYSEDKKQPKETVIRPPIYIYDGKEDRKRDWLAEHIRDTGCGPKAGKECGRTFGW